MNDFTILYVEDDDTVRENFTEILENYFINIFTSNNGKEALSIFMEHKIDIVLLDISIPYINGLKVAAKIREINTSVEIIVLTAYSEKEKLLQALNLQLFAYLIKPIQHKEFDKTIRSLLLKLKKDEILYLNDGFKWNKTRKELFYKDINIKLTNNEYLIISLLCNNTSKYFSIEDISIEISSAFENKASNSITQLISRFKNKINKQFNINDFFIQNTYSLGYKIILK